MNQQTHTNIGAQVAAITIGADAIHDDVSLARKVREIVSAAIREEAIRDERLAAFHTRVSGQAKETCQQEGTDADGNVIVIASQKRGGGRVSVKLEGSARGVYSIQQVRNDGAFVSSAVICRKGSSHVLKGARGQQPRETQGRSTKGIAQRIADAIVALQS